MISVIGPPMDDHAIETPIRPLQIVYDYCQLVLFLSFFFSEGLMYLSYVVYTNL
jgi:hypothetical protein